MLAASLASTLLPRYNDLKKHLALVEAKRQEIFESDRDLVGINREKMTRVAGPNAIVALAQALNDPVYRTMFEDSLQDPGAIEDFSKLTKEWLPKFAPGFSAKDAHSPAELISLIQEASPVMQTRREALYKKLEISDEMAVMVEDGVSTGLMSNFIEHYMKDAGWRLDPATQTLLSP